MRIRCSEEVVDESVGVGGRDWLAGKQDPVVDGTGELVGRELDIGA